MTVSTTVTRSPYYQGDGTTFEFTFNFNITREDELVVYVIDGVNVTTLTLNQDYTVTFDEETEDGVVELIDSQLLPSGKTLVIVRSTPITQETRFKDLGKFSPAMHERSFDRIIQILQENAFLKDYAIRFPDYETPENNITPSKTERAGKTLVFDENGGVSLGTTNIGDSLMTLQELTDLIDQRIQLFWDQSMTVGGTEGARTLDINTHSDGGADDGAEV